jgi:tetratricopeptide (TPR) repeat protein
MGGAGKTAITERFLNDALEANNEQDGSLPPPYCAFVYSFYDDDKPENFFRNLQFWLEGSSVPANQKSPTQLIFDIQQHQGLIILDGLEKVQESGARSGFGKLISPSLRNLLNHIANGSARELSVLVTSRFPLTDLRDNQPRFFTSIAVEEIDVAAGVALLRDRGVLGTDAQLASVVEHCGQHALTVDLAGGYIKEYGGGEPATPLDLGTAGELQAAVEQEPDDDKRAVLRQGFRFARIAQRYREAMLSSDEAALALLERICLFRAGVDCETLGEIFTGPNARSVSGQALASLNSEELQKKIDWLVKMRIVEGSKPSLPKSETRNGKTLLTIHPAVRDGFLSGIAREDREVSHEAIRTQLEVSLGDNTGYLPSDPAVLDVLEEIVFHAIASGRVTDAIDIYTQRIGGYQHLFWNLSAFERGLRLSVLLDKHVGVTERVRYTWSKNRLSRGELHSGWARFLIGLGDISSAITHFEVAATSGNVSRGDCHHEIALLHAQTGQLSLGMKHCEICFGYRRSAKKGTGQSQWRNAFASRGRIRSLTGEVEGAINDYEESLKWQTRTNRWERSRTLYGMRGFHYALLLSWIGRFGQAQDLVSFNVAEVLSLWSPLNPVRPQCELLQATLDFERENAWKVLDETRDWSISNGAKELLCRADLTRGRFLLSDAENSVNHQDRLDLAEDIIRQSLKLARDCGFGLYHIDLQLQFARLHLIHGNAQAALDGIRVALDQGIPANDETGQPELLAANDEECGYAWGIVEGLHLRGKALLLQAAQSFGTKSFDTTQHDQLPSEVRELIAQADDCLDDAMKRWHDLRDPEPTEDNNFIHPETGVEYSYKAEETYLVLKDLKGGTLTRYPLEPLAEGRNEEPLQATEPAKTEKVSEGTKSMSKKHLFLSYCRDNKAEVSKLRDNLIAAGEQVWWDQDILGGHDWKLEIRKAMRDAYAIVVCLSTETADRITSGVYTEVLDAIAAYREHAPGSIFLIPVRLSECDIPLIEIDGTRTLDRLNYVDLFETDGFDKLIRSIQASSLHP